MNTNHFELIVAQYTPSLNLRWIMTGEGLRMQWTPDAAQPEGGTVLPFTATSETYSEPAA